MAYEVYSNGEEPYPGLTNIQVPSYRNLETVSI